MIIDMNEIIIKTILNYIDVETMNICMHIPCLKMYLVPLYYDRFIMFKNNYNLEDDYMVIEAKKCGFYNENDYDDMYILNKYLEKIYGYEVNNDNSTDESKK